MAKQMVKERQDITGSNCLKGVSGKVIVDEKGIKDTWKEYMEKLMNEENEWDHRISAGVKEGPADCIKTSEVTTFRFSFEDFWTFTKIFVRLCLLRRHRLSTSNLASKLIIARERMSGA